MKRMSWMKIMHAIVLYTWSHCFIDLIVTGLFPNKTVRFGLLESKRTIAAGDEQKTLAKATGDYAIIRRD